MFTSLHTMFMAQYTELWNAVDPIAERIRSLGVAAPGSYAQFGGSTTLKMRRRPAQGDGDGARARARATRRWPAPPAASSPPPTRPSDEPTADLLTQRIAVHEQTAWMLRSLLEE